MGWNQYCWVMGMVLYSFCLLNAEEYCLILSSRKKSYLQTIPQGCMRINKIMQAMDF